MKSITEDEADLKDDASERIFVKRLSDDIQSGVNSLRMS